MKRLLLLSNSTNFGESYLEYPKQPIKDFLGDHIREVLFIPYAGVGIGYDNYTSKVAAPFSTIGYEVRSIHTYENPVDAVNNAEALAVGGGNTFELLNQLYNNDLINVIRKNVVNGMPFIGWSAGSNIAGPTIKTTNDMPIVEPPSFDALNVVPFQINPHYTEEILPNHGGENRIDRINEFVALNPKISVVGIPEGNLLIVEGEAVTIVGPGVLKVFRNSHQVQTYSSPKPLDFLMN